MSKNTCKNVLSFLSPGDSAVVARRERARRGDYACVPMPSGGDLPYTRFDNEASPVAPGGQQLRRCKAVLTLVGLTSTSLLLASSSRVEAMPQLLDETALFNAADNATHSLDSAQPSPLCSQLPDMTCGAWPLYISTLVGIVSGPILVPVFFAALCCCGFGPAGVIAGSCAAGCQVPVTVGGGFFATLQSCGALGCWRASAAVKPLLILCLLLALAGGFIGMDVAGVCACDWPPPLELAKASTAAGLATVKESTAAGLEHGLEAVGDVAAVVSTEVSQLADDMRSALGSWWR